jgi:hypothetical protein
VEEAVLAQVLPPDITCSTNAGLVVPGSTLLVRVVVVLTTGNVKGSQTLKIVRPAG